MFFGVSCLISFLFRNSTTNHLPTVCSLAFSFYKIPLSGRQPLSQGASEMVQNYSLRCPVNQWETQASFPYQIVKSVSLRTLLSFILSVSLSDIPSLFSFIQFFPLSNQYPPQLDPMAEQIFYLSQYLISRNDSQRAILMRLPIN